ncbi:S8 family serine peptidase [Hyalangium sp.]|uniref:S8 family serine peptidase n=1 Tax=Hyalangium sp. TaxID=2028555 RepID=UPI002D4021EA|nr:S8 family serine peptidase [Hyalangium sp.]HYH96401.1 S8 family serine peptidase [Hyalangium sp.]
MLALGPGIGCDEQEASSNPPENPADMDGFTAPVVTAPEDVRIPGEYIVVFAEGVARASIDAAASRIAQAGGENQVMHRYSVIPGFAARIDAAALNGLRRNLGVVYIEENQKVSLNTTFPSPAVGIDRADQRLGRDGMYNDHGRTGAGVHVYILDTGINSQHTEFTGRLNGGFTAITDGRGTEDCHGHGTHVASTAAGTVYGMAKHATIHPVRVLACDGFGSWAGIIAGVDFVRNDCLKQKTPCVANMSLGGGRVAAVNAAVANAVDSGVTFVVAAANANQDACFTSPAGEPKAITVGAVDNEDKRAGFSNWGACVDLFAPGVDILGAWIGGTTATRIISGTSMASPHVAGAAAQYLSSNPGATPAQIEAAIKGSVSLDCVGDPKGSPNALLFTDLNQGNYYCSNQPGSCQGLCGGAGNGCFCDPSCEIYNDCCADYAQVCR